MVPMLRPLSMKAQDQKWGYKLPAPDKPSLPFTKLVRRMGDTAIRKVVSKGAYKGDVNFVVFSLAYEGRNVFGVVERERSRPVRFGFIQLGNQICSQIPIDGQATSGTCAAFEGFEPFGRRPGSSLEADTAEKFGSVRTAQLRALRDLIGTQAVEGVSIGRARDRSKRLWSDLLSSHGAVFDF